jgi:hypothetical protein
MSTDRPSKSRANRAGDVIRACHAADDHSSAAYLVARGDVEAFRELWSAPLASVWERLSSIKRNTGITADITPRHKRLARIIEKLLRPEHHTMNLSQMDDIGGCRVVVATIDELRRIQASISGTWAADKATKDYIAHPKEDGYRAVHMYVRCDDVRIEVQLRRAFNTRGPHGSSGWRIGGVSTSAPVEGRSRHGRLCVESPPCCPCRMPASCLTMRTLPDSRRGWQNWRHEARLLP